MQNWSRSIFGSTQQQQTPAELYDAIADGIFYARALFDVARSFDGERSGQDATPDAVGYLGTQIVERIQEKCAALWEHKRAEKTAEGADHG